MSWYGCGGDIRPSKPKPSHDALLYRDLYPSPSAEHRGLSLPICSINKPGAGPRQRIMVHLEVTGKENRALCIANADRDKQAGALKNLDNGLPKHVPNWTHISLLSLHAGARFWRSHYCGYCPDGIVTPISGSHHIDDVLLQSEKCTKSSFTFHPEALYSLCLFRQWFTDLGMYASFYKQGRLASSRHRESACVAILSHGGGKRSIWASPWPDTITASIIHLIH